MIITKHHIFFFNSTIKLKMSILTTRIYSIRKYALNYLKALSIITFCYVITTSCMSNKNYKGELAYFTDNEEATDLLSSTTIKIDSLYYSPYIKVVDSIAIFYNYKEKNAFELVDLSTGKRIGSFCPIGQGHEEFIGLSPISQIYQEKNEKKTVLFAPNECKMLIWNISESLKLKRTVYEDAIAYSWKNNTPVAYCNQTLIGKDSVLLSLPSIHISSEDKITLPGYQIRTLKSNELISEINIFNHTVDNKDSRVMPENFYGAFCSVKPDRSKFAEAMTWLPQINVVDIKTGKIAGCRRKDTQDESGFSTNMESALFCYKSIASDNHYIYALWIGVSKNELQPDMESYTVHVFDWDGQFVQKIKLEHPINELTISSENGFLYGWNLHQQILYQYDLTFI